MSPTASATTYAQALVLSALGGWVDQLAAVQRNLRRNPELSVVLNDPNAVPTDRESAVARIVPPTAAPEVARFVRLLAQQGDLRLLDEILRRVREIVPTLDESSDVVVTSAHPLTGSEQEKLETKLRAEQGDEIRIRYEVDPELLGGLRIRIGDRVIDHTVAARLDALRSRLTS